MSNTKKVYIGKLKGEQIGVSAIYLRDFSWDCDRYWSGGYIGNNQLHCHFDGCFLEAIDPRGHPLGNFVTPWQKNTTDLSKVVTNGCSVWEGIEFFLDNVPDEIQKNWWRIKDLYKQFYALKEAAQVFRLGGHCCSADNMSKDEINPEMEKMINSHIENVVIREVRKILNFQ